MTEPDSNPPNPPDLTDPATQKALVKSGCMTVVGWIVLIAAYLAVFFTAERVVEKLMAPPPGADVIVFGCASCIGRQMVTGSLFAIMLLLAAVAIVKHVALALLLTGAIVAGVGYFNWYMPFTAITFHRERVELHYLWPRPSVSLDKGGIVQTDALVSTQIRGEGGSDFRYSLQIKTKSQKFESMDVGLQSPVSTAMDRIGPEKKRR
jgi:hypothetical protein